MLRYLSIELHRGNYESAFDCIDGEFLYNISPGKAASQETTESLLKIVDIASTARNAFLAKSAGDARIKTKKISNSPQIGIDSQ